MKRSLVSQEEKRKSISRNNDWKLPKFGERHKFIGAGNSQVLNRINSKKTIPRHIITKLLKTKNRENTESS